ncbi:MAG: hypothetical protein ACTHQQ_23205 [Solirubrobacteraceae bacterium]
MASPTGYQRERAASTDPVPRLLLLPEAVAQGRALGIAGGRSG